MCRKKSIIWQPYLLWLADDCIRVHLLFLLTPVGCIHAQWKSSRSTRVSTLLAVLSCLANSRPWSTAWRRAQWRPRVSPATTTRGYTSVTSTPTTRPATRSLGTRSTSISARSRVVSKQRNHFRSDIAGVLWVFKVLRSKSRCLSGKSLFFMLGKCSDIGGSWCLTRIRSIYILYILFFITSMLRVQSQVFTLNVKF